MPGQLAPRDLAPRRQRMRERARQHQLVGHQRFGDQLARGAFEGADAKVDFAVTHLRLDLRGEGVVQHHLDAGLHLRIPCDRAWKQQ